MTREELLHEAGFYKAAFSYARKKVRGAGGGAWHYARTTKRDVKTMTRAHRKLRNVNRYELLRQARTNIVPGARAALGVTAAQAKKSAATVARTDKINTLLVQSRNQAVRRNAVRVGAVALGAGALAWGAKTYRLKKRQAQERPQFSSYDVYPQLGHAAARQQVHNRPVYYDDRDAGGGPPRVEDMNMTREELIEMSVKALIGGARNKTISGMKYTKGKIRGYRRGQAAKLKKYEKRMAQDPLAQARHGSIMGWKSAVKTGIGAAVGATVGAKAGRSIGRVAPLASRHRTALKFAKKYPKLSTSQTMWPAHRAAIDARTSRTQSGGGIGQIAGMAVGAAGGAYLAHKLKARDHRQAMMFTRGRPHYGTSANVQLSKLTTKDIEKRRAKKLREELISALMETLHAE